MPTLDCGSSHAAANSVSTILGVSRPELDKWLTAFDFEAYYDSHHRDMSSDDMLLAAMCADLGVMPDASWDTTCYFHMTRTLTPESFRDGIEPLTLARVESIWQSLYRLVSVDVTPAQWERFRAVMEAEGNDLPPGSDRWPAELYCMKVADVATHGGPYGELVHDVAFSPKELHHHDYLDIPEIVEDIGRCFGAYFRNRPGVNLTDRFRSAATPCIVKFRAWDASNGSLATAINYVYGDVHGDRLTFDLSWGYSANGRQIPASDVLDIEVSPVR